MHLLAFIVSRTIGDAYLTRNEITVLVLCDAKTLSNQQHSIHTMTYRTALNGSETDIPRSKPANTTLRTAARCSFYLRPFSPANFMHSMYRGLATTIPGMAPIERCYEQTRQNL